MDAEESSAEERRRMDDVAWTTCDERQARHRRGFAHCPPPAA
ncbi:hypothetical protein [Streptomyces huasconensis]